MPYRRSKNREHISQREKKKTEQEEKKKKIRTKTERKGKKTKKERRESVQRACTNKSYLSPKNANKNFPIGTITIQGRLPQSH